ncbi:hypothetical protein MPER_09425 [Moniliophthora perniciosa FA553]|nr:hypothetical protein MPER_09425 [Moniliophthora perniciosa FA553]
MAIQPFQRGIYSISKQRKPRSTFTRLSPPPELTSGQTDPAAGAHRNLIHIQRVYFGVRLGHAPDSSQIPIYIITNQVHPNTSDSTVAKPWRGRFIVSGMRASDVGSSQDIKVTAVETDGTTAPYALPILAQLQNYLNARPGAVQLVTFLPERLRDPNTNTVNQSNFRNLARLLFESLSGGGMLIFPVANSSAMLLGAVFMGQPFPDFVYAAQSPHQSLPNTSASYATGSSRRSEPSISIPNISRSEDQRRHFPPSPSHRYGTHYKVLVAAPLILTTENNPT